MLINVKGGGRNTGIKAAKGNYIVFIDCDDVFLPDKLPVILKELSKGNDLDILMYDFQQTRLGKTESLFYVGNDTAIVSGLAFIKKNEMSYAPWDYAFRREFLLDNHLFFVEHLQFEDGDWCMSALMQASKVKYVPVAVCHYIINETSTTSCSNGAENIRDAFESALRWQELYKRTIPIDSVAAQKVKWHWVLGAKVDSYRLVHVRSLSEKYHLLKKYYGHRYNQEGVYLWFLSTCPFLSACAIHLLTPLLLLYIQNKHK